jgi:hypothetical protein
VQYERPLLDVHSFQAENEHQRIIRIIRNRSRLQKGFQRLILLRTR